ncbi:hypothetical protein GGX14DRAFT_384069 [Mycena pura]|uniref:Uncharacterized protein n=1 Tax=Mycena pura TaxID=153505 RepID=A0AAD6YUP0_9AGAR|nr:hypothetical protein GGX14DRAFT_384069 [Mycena pura]
MVQLQKSLKDLQMHFVPPRGTQLIEVPSYLILDSSSDTSERVMLLHAEVPAGPSTNFGDSDPFKPGTERMRLGRHGIRYEQLRLLEAISFNGQDFYLRIAAVD